LLYPSLTAEISSTVGVGKKRKPGRPKKTGIVLYVKI